MKSRRAFIKFAALSPLASALPVLSCAATPFSGKFVVTLQAIGGWDVTCFCDPKENQPGEATITQWSKTDEAKSIGRIKYAPFAKNEAFFRKHASKMLVINGVDTLTNAHSIGETTSWSGRIASGYPSITKWLNSLLRLADSRNFTNSLTFELLKLKIISDIFLKKGFCMMRASPLRNFFNEFTTKRF